MKKIFPILALLLCMFTVINAAWTADAGTAIQQNLPAGYEPSGIVWHPHFNALFLVSDGGTLSKMNVDGTNVTNWAIGGDFEGVTVADPSSNYVYVVVEYPFEIIRFNASRGGVSARVNLTNVIPATINTNSGLEGLAYVPNGYHPYANVSSGGLFYFAVQENGAIYVVNVDFTSSKATLVTSFTPVPGRTDLADLYFSTETKTLYLVYDANNLIREIKVDNTLITEYVAPGLDQEGITILPGCPNTKTILFIGEDSGRVMKYGDYPITCPVAPPVDNDKDGYAVGVDCNDNDANINPGKTEILYNNKDDDCNAATKDTIDADSDGYNSNVDCNDNNAAINPGKTEVLYDGIDNDCNAATKDTVDADSDGYNSNVDCNDNNAAINPGKTEIVGNGIDDDCNTLTLDVLPPEKITFEAEQMPKISGNNVIRLTDSIAFYSNGYAQEARTFNSGTYTVTTYARADLVSGKIANLRISIDGVTVGNYPVKSATFVPIKFTKTLTQGQHTIRVQFTNDYHAWFSSKDLNIYVDKVIFEK